MTQDELNSLLAQDINSVDLEANKETTSDKEEIKPELVDPNTYKPEANKKWPPPPPTEEHKVVHQLDDVTRDSEVKMTEVFDQIELVSNAIVKIEKDVKQIREYIKTQEEMLGALVENFPNIKAFAASLEQTKQLKSIVKDIADNAMDCSDACMQTMDIMQYQDIHRQKIERVINVMRALSQYMNSLFEGRGEDSRRVASATYIAGDDNSDVATESDIEALISSFGRKS